MSSREHTRQFHGLMQFTPLYSIVSLLHNLAAGRLVGPVGIIAAAVPGQVAIHANPAVRVAPASTPTISLPAVFAWLPQIPQRSARRPHGAGPTVIVSLLPL